MSGTLSYSAINKRFDFAVPLEDIFTDYKIHPRLTYILQQAYELYLETHLSIEDILKEHCLNECLQLKERIIYEIQPGINLQCTSPSVYFWIIRHFLGLLPISLIPSVTTDHKFPWKDLSQNCKNFLCSELRTKDDCNYLHLTVARTLSFLSREHIVLLNALVVFIREISRRKFCKKTLVCLAKYFCDAVFVRPFRPGHLIKHETMLPLFIFIITKWNRISKNLTTETVSMFPYANSYIGFEIEKNYLSNNYTQMNYLTSEKMKLENEPNVFIKRLKDVECQTTSCSLVSHDKSLQVENILDVATDGDISLNSLSNLPRIPRMSSFVSSLVDIKEEEDLECKRCESNLFNSTLKNDQLNNWNDVVEEIAKTVQKVDGYNFENEDTLFQSVEECPSVSSQLSDSTFDTGSIETEYNSFQNSTLKSTKNESKLANYLPLKNDDKKMSDDKVRLQNESVYRSFYDSDEELYNTNGKEHSNIFNWEANDVEYTTSNFSLKKFKIKFNFFRTLSPKFKRSSENFKSVAAKNIKYKKIKTLS